MAHLYCWTQTPIHIWVLISVPKMGIATIGDLDPDWNPSPVSVQYNVAIWFGIQRGVGIGVRVRQCKCVIILSPNKIPCDTNLMKVLTLQLGLLNILI